MNKRNTLVGPQLQKPSLSFHPDWKRFAAFGVVLVIGAVTATQLVANSLRFSHSLGWNVFGFYPPWSFWLWARQWEAGEPKIFAQAFGIGSVTSHASQGKTVCSRSSSTSSRGS
jgi:hypothetical protein